MVDGDSLLDLGDDVFMRWLAFLFVLLVGSGCASTEKALHEASAGTCEAKCRAEHEDSLYDENRCIETLCTTPAD